MQRLGVPVRVVLHVMALTMGTFVGLLGPLHARADFDLGRAQPIAARTAALAIAAAKTCQGFRINSARLATYLGLASLTLEDAEHRFRPLMEKVVDDFAYMNSVGEDPCEPAFQRLGPNNLNLLSR